MREVLAIRRSFTALVLATSVAGVTGLWQILRVDGFTPLEIVFLAIFAVLFAWNSASFWMSCLGAYARWRGAAQGALHWPCDGDVTLETSRARTAIVMPIYNEDTDRVFASIAAIRASLTETGAGAKFDIFILSDSTKPEHRAAEKAAWRRLQDAIRDDGPGVFYRNRALNTGRKSGNIAEFCENWGALYDYMIVLDADSLMTGETSVALVRLMDRNPRAAIIQVPPLLFGRESLFARIQQFSAGVYGPLYAAGFAMLHGSDGNYWGHNAIIRVRPFMHHCGLPKLPGSPPFGGEILSHDFVEAALLRRSGWELHLAPQLGGSYEEPPPTIIDHLKRDRRWCQGNLQHVRLIFAQGFRLPSRMHFVNGVMSYVSSLLWLLMLVVSVAVSYENSGRDEAVSYIGRHPILRWPVSHVFEVAILITAMIALLFGPKLLALAVLARDHTACRAHGGRLKVALSMLTESVLSMLLAPVAMLSHCWFIASILAGRSTGWGSQRRTDYRPSVLLTALTFAPHTLIAIGAALFLYAYVPDTFLWFAPVTLGAALSIPLACATSSRRMGLLARRMGLFLVPSETVGVPIIQRREALAEGQALSAA